MILTRLPKLWVSPVSENVLKAVHNTNRRFNRTAVGLIASENQVSFEGGYTGFTNDTLSMYVDNWPFYPFLARDHSSCQHKILNFDINVFDIIHVDPFKNHGDPFKDTLETILCCYRLNPFMMFEIGTEEAVCPYNHVYLENLLNYLRRSLPEEIFNNITYAVIQCGTKLKNGRNIGVVDMVSLSRMSEVCKSFGIIPKEHNADFQMNELIERKSKLVPELTINIAPEIAYVESGLIYDQSSEDVRERLFELCLANKNAKRWFSEDYDLVNNRRNVVASLCHYLFQTEEFKKLTSDYRIDSYIQSCVELFLSQKLLALHEFAQA